MEIRKISLLGHKDHGKSTLIGKILILTNSIPETRIQEAMKAADELGVEFEPAYLLDTFVDERSEGMTFDNTRAQLLYKGVGFELIDVPGHEELIKSMLSGASISRFSLVVVSAKEDEGITTQTRRHIYVSRLLGISKFIVAVNKMDLSNFNYNVFNSIKEDLTTFFRSIGISDDLFTIIPISAFTGENIIKKSQNMPWYHGSTLLEELKMKTILPADSYNDAARIFLQSSMKLDGNRIALLGEVLSGHFTSSENLMVFPGGNYLAVSQFMRGNKLVKEVRKGDGVALITKTSRLNKVRGLVVVNDKFSIRVSEKLELRLFFLDKPSEKLTLYLNNVGTRVQDLNIQNVVDPTTGYIIGRHDIEPLDTAEIKVTLSNAVACDVFERCMELGRVVLSSKSKIIAAGIITSIN